MTIEAKIVKSEVKKDGATIFLDNEGMSYKKAVLDCDLSDNIRFMRKNTKAGRNVRIHFEEIYKDNLLVNDIEFLTSSEALYSRIRRLENDY